MKTFTRIYTTFLLVTMLGSISFSAIGQGSVQSVDVGHLKYRVEEQYLQHHTELKERMDPTSLGSLNNQQNRDEYVYLMDTAYINSNAINPQRYIYTYSEYGFRVSTLIQIRQLEEWVNSSLEACTYDELGNKLASLWRSWENSNWINSSKVIFTYDDNSNLISYLRQDWYNGDWLNSDMGESLYNSNGDIVSFLLQIWSSNAWLNYSKEIYTYDVSERLDKLTTQLWNVTYWYNDLQYTYTYDTFENIETELSEYWEDNVWKNNLIESYTYNTINYPITLLVELWQSDVWINSENYAYEYNSLGNINQSVKRKWEDGVWANLEKLVYAYGSYGELEALLSKNWDGGWVDTTMYQYVSDDFGNTTQGQFYTWFENNWSQHLDGLLTLAYNYSLSGESFGGFIVDAHYYAIPVGIETHAINATSNIISSPNPASTHVDLRFDLIEDNHIDFNIYDITGKMVISIFNGNILSGNHHYHITTEQLPSGMYFARLTTAGATSTIKLLIKK